MTQTLRTCIIIVSVTRPAKIGHVDAQNSSTFFIYITFLFFYDRAKKYSLFVYKYFGLIIQIISCRIQILLRYNLFSDMA